MKTNFSQEQLSQLLNQTLGENLTDRELQTCWAKIEIVEPAVAKLFWQSKDAQAGIYVVLTGKVRLLDSDGNLISTLAVGSSFGEITLFPQENLSFYAARASTNLKLCYLSIDILQTLMTKYPKICDRLLVRAKQLAELTNSQEAQNHRQSTIPNVIPFPANITPKKPQPRAYFPLLKSKPNIYGQN